MQDDGPKIIKLPGLNGGPAPVHRVGAETSPNVVRFGPVLSAKNREVARGPLGADNLRIAEDARRAHMKNIVHEPARRRMNDFLIQSPELHAELRQSMDIRDVIWFVKTERVPLETSRLGGKTLALSEFLANLDVKDREASLEMLETWFNESFTAASGAPRFHMVTSITPYSVFIERV